MFHAAFASLSASKPHAGQECSCTHSGFSVEASQDALFRRPTRIHRDKIRSFPFALVFGASVGTFPTPLPLGSASCQAVRSSPLRPSPPRPRSRIRGRSSSRACGGSPVACSSTRRDARPRHGAVSPNLWNCVPSARGRVGRVPTAHVHRIDRTIRTASSVGVVGVLRIPTSMPTHFGSLRFRGRSSGVSTPRMAYHFPVGSCLTVTVLISASSGRARWKVSGISPSFESYSRVRPLVFLELEAGLTVGETAVLARCLPLELLS